MPNHAILAVHRNVMDNRLAEYWKGDFRLHVPTYTLADLQRAYPTGRLRCGSCGEALKKQRVLETSVDRWSPSTAITFALRHDYFPDEPTTGEQAPVGAHGRPAQCPVLYSDGVREEYILHDDGRYELLHGIVYRDARAPERVYREVWYPTGVFTNGEEVSPNSLWSGNAEEPPPRSWESCLVPKHEVIVERIPDEFQGKPVRLPPVSKMPHYYTWTVANYRANNPLLRHECMTCGILLDMSSLVPVFDAWGPDAMITVSLSCHWVPGEPRPKLGELPKPWTLAPRNRANQADRGPMLPRSEGWLRICSLSGVADRSPVLPESECRTQHKRFSEFPIQACTEHRDG